MGLSLHVDLSHVATTIQETDYLPGDLFEVLYQENFTDFSAATHWSACRKGQISYRENKQTEVSLHNSVTHAFFFLCRERVRQNICMITYCFQLSSYLKWAAQFRTSKKSNIG